MRNFVQYITSLRFQSYLPPLSRVIGEVIEDLMLLAFPFNMIIFLSATSHCGIIITERYPGFLGSNKKCFNSFNNGVMTHTEHISSSSLRHHKIPLFY